MHTVMSILCEESRSAALDLDIIAREGENPYTYCMLYLE